MLDELDPEQREVAASLQGPVCVLAGAGTGKTRAITHRIAYAAHTGVVDPATVLAVTFTTRAAGEMRSRLQQLGVPAVQARTFHSAALRQARYFWPKVYGGPLPSLIESKLSLLGEAAHRCRIKDVGVAELRDLASEVEWAKVSNVTPERYAELAAKAGRGVAEGAAANGGPARAGGFDADTVARVFAAYEEVKRSRERIDMEDVLLCAAALLAEDPRVADEVRRQYRWFVVDEFQDVNAIQRALLDLWLGDREELCVVGDPSQTIYSFAGASSDHLLGFRRRYPDAKTVRLVRNYRSTPQVVGVANGLLGGARHRVMLQAERPSGPEVRFQRFGDPVEEAESIAAEIAGARDRGVPLRDIAVLFRINAQSEPFEEALVARDVPSLVRGVERFFDRPEVRQAVTLLRGAARSPDRSGDGLVADMTAVLGSVGWSPAPPAAGSAGRARWESLEALRALAQELAASAPEAGLEELVAEIDRRVTAQHAPVADGVTLASMHAAKGLEWPIVYVVGVQDGTVPIVYADTPEQVEEERRLLYVAATRARDQLSISWSAARAPGERAHRRPSRFLDGVVPSSREETRTARPRRRKPAAVARCRVCGNALHDAVERKLGRCADCPWSYDERLFEELRTWRAEQAREENVPAYCVFTDATLTAIAEMCPQDSESLLKISGIGRVKLDKYSHDVLKICAAQTS
ncbi:MAG: AAA family ATPase [Propionibacteriales bacterium]|nr:AAA family ATPase [Propionibacteriales bacterium]